MAEAAFLVMRAVRRERVFRDRTDPLDVSDEVILARYRLRRDMIQELSATFAASPQAHTTGRNHGVNPVQQVWINC